MLIDCDLCSVRGKACRDCVVTVILNNSACPVELDETEQYAVGTLAAGGLVPPLRLVRDARLTKPQCDKPQCEYCHENSC